MFDKHRRRNLNRLRHSPGFGHVSGRQKGVLPDSGWFFAGVAE